MGVKYDLPVSLYDEYDEYASLATLQGRTNTGNLSYTSTSSGTTYNSTTGQEGMLNILQATPLVDHIISASDFNNKAQKYGEDNYFSATPLSSTYLVTISDTTFTYTEGQRVFIKPATSNTGATSININSLGAKTIKKMTRTGLVDLENYNILANNIYELFYNGTYYILMNVSNNDYEEIDSITLESNAAQVDFTIPSGYKKLKLEFNTISSTTTTRFLILRFNDDSTTNYYEISQIFDGDTSMSGTVDSTADRIAIDSYSLPSNSSAFQNASGFIEIYNYNATLGKNIVFNYINPENLYYIIGGGTWKNVTDSITKISVIASADAIGIGSTLVLKGCR